jgi:hypothetical protein
MAVDGSLGSFVHVRPIGDEATGLLQGLATTERAVR